MTAQAFDTEITDTDGALIGPWRQPRQMLQAQTYDAHASIHDDATAQKLGAANDVDVLARGPVQLFGVGLDLHTIHDDATAQKLGFKGGTIEGPTHFSQFAPLGARLWGQAWFESGCLSAHYRSVCYEGEAVEAQKGA